MCGQLLKKIINVTTNYRSGVFHVAYDTTEKGMLGRDKNGRCKKLEQLSHGSQRVHVALSVLLTAAMAGPGEWGQKGPSIFI